MIVIPVTPVPVQEMMFAPGASMGKSSSMSVTTLFLSCVSSRLKHSPSSLSRMIPPPRSSTSTICVPMVSTAVPVPVILMRGALLYVPGLVTVSGFPSNGMSSPLSPDAGTWYRNGDTRKGTVSPRELSPRPLRGVSTSPTTRAL